MRATATTTLKHARGNVQAPGVMSDRPEKEALAKMSVLDALQRYANNTVRHKWRETKRIAGATNKAR